MKRRNFFSVIAAACMAPFVKGEIPVRYGERMCLVVHHTYDGRIVASLNGKLIENASYPVQRVLMRHWLKPGDIHIESFA